MNDKITLPRNLLEEILQTCAFTLTEVAYNQLHSYLADPVPPAGGEPEVFAWSLDVPKPGQLGGIITTEFKESCVRADGSPGGFEHTVPLIRLSDHRAHVTRLQAEVERLKTTRQELAGAVHSFTAEVERLKSESFEGLYNAVIDQRDALQAELTKARELADEVYKGYRQVLSSYMEGKLLEFIVGNQPVTADKSSEECVHEFRMFLQGCVKCGEPYKD